MGSFYSSWITESDAVGTEVNRCSFSVNRTVCSEVEETDISIKKTPRSTSSFCAHVQWCKCFIRVTWLAYKVDWRPWQFISQDGSLEINVLSNFKLIIASRNISLISRYIPSKWEACCYEKRCYYLNTTETVRTLKTILVIFRSCCSA